jgi:molybdopterin converting factor subunit 1
MTLTVHLFARARELAGSGTVRLEVAGPATVADLRRALAGQFAALAGLLERSAVAVNHDFAEDSRTVAAGDEVAVIPPVSGG